MDISEPENQATLQIPIDLFVAKKRNGLQCGGDRGGLRFTDSSGELVFRVESQSYASTRRRVVVDSSGSPLIFIDRNPSGCWQGFKGGNSEERVSIFRVERTQNSMSRTEFEIFPASENGEESNSDFKMKGSPFHRSCTIYSGNSIVAQTSLMYKLGIQKGLIEGISSSSLVPRPLALTKIDSEDELCKLMGQTLSFGS